MMVIDYVRWGKVVVDCPGWVEMIHVGRQIMADGHRWDRMGSDGGRLSWMG